MENTVKYPQDTIKVFKECQTCSRTFGYLLNRAFGHPKELEEKALALMAGGLMNQGHQCGMLWGAALAAGAEAYRQQDNLDEAIAAAVTATQHVIESFLKRTNTVNCREIIEIDLSKFLGMVKFIIKTSLQKEKNNPCFNLAEQWAPEAIQSASKGLSEKTIELKQKPVSCASEVVRKMGGSEEEMAMVAGFAGGLGLSGKACGALSAAIWMKTLEWCKENPGKDPPYFNNQNAKKKLKAFLEKTNGEFLCKKISGRCFENLNEHSEFVCNGGCNKILNVLVSA